MGTQPEQNGGYVLDEGNDLDLIFAEVDGGICAPAGILAGGIHAGLYPDPDRFDLALICAQGDNPCAAGMFTTNTFCAAPVQVSREHVADGACRAIVLNAGNANAATGDPGLAAARATTELVASVLGIDAEEVLVASTGVIGVPLDLEPLENSIQDLADGLNADGGHAAARAILTTDTRPKEGALTFGADGVRYTVGGMCKGSGMMQPNMATMLAVLTTDLPLTPEAAHCALESAVGVSFNKVTVDSDTSTNDSVFLLSSGAGGGSPVQIGTPAYDSFAAALRELSCDLAREIARDGEGASKLVTVELAGAATAADADAAARSVANSPLVKTAIGGHDCNWGRIAAALGKSGATFEQNKVDIDIMGLPVCRAGLTVGFDEDEALRRFEADEIVISIDLHAGSESTQVWTCDLTHGYISINADYRS